MTMYGDEELRGAGWSERDITAYQRGYATALGRIPARPAGTARQIAATAPRWVPGEPGAFSGHSDRAAWQRNTPAGRLSLLLPPPDEAGELAGARALADRHELTYGRRPSMTECLAAVRHNGPRGLDFHGEAAELGTLFRSVGLPFAIVHQVEQPQAGGVVFGPGGRTQEFGPAIAVAPRV
jgi:hypothetical protein